MKSSATFRFLLRARFHEGDVTTRWVPSTRQIVSEVETAIDAAWQTLLARPGVRLFDGKLCRFEAMHASANQLTIDLSPATYRTVAGTNFTNPQFVDTYGPGVMANPVGVSTLLHTADEFLMLGRRNRSVAYYPDRVHPFAGSMEVEPAVDPFANVRRELREELSLQAADIRSVTCLGIAEDSALRHPELIFVTRTHRCQADVLRTLDAAEHSAAWSVPANADAVHAARRDPSLTPIALAAVEAWAAD